MCLARYLGKFSWLLMLFLAKRINLYRLVWEIFTCHYCLCVWFIAYYAVL